ncbi:Adenylosuccinate synthetase [Nocardioides sp. PD653]|nr:MULTISPECIES: hypothetical protein [unclassified Nocardioides]GAW49662.1 Adenylosuccinate synthetase [Nocardioides sp. PD653-B2]GAW56598.1 Adenylosuccinate synthetase [Nocardioides sp. PD653]
MVDVAKQPVVAVAVGLGGVGAQPNGAADRRESLRQAGGVLGVALGRLRRVGDFGGFDPEQADSVELAPAGVSTRTVSPSTTAVTGT